MLDWLGWIRSESIEDLLARKEHEKAIRQIRAELRLHPGGRRLRLTLADALVAVGRREEAVDTLMSLGDDLVAAGALAQALAVFKRVRSLDPGRAVDVDEKLERLVDRGREPRAPGKPAPPPPAATRGEGAPGRPAVAAPVPTELTPLGNTPGAGPVDTPLFAGFAPESALAVMRALQLVLCEAGQIVVTEGEPGDSMYLVSSGRLRAFVRNKVGRSVEVSQLEAGTFFGEMAVLTGRRRSATLVAASRCELLQLDKPMLQAIVKEHPEVKGVLREMWLRREAASALVKGRKARPAPRALAAPRTGRGKRKPPRILSQ